MKNLKIRDFTDYRFLSELGFSPDGKKIAFIVKKADLDMNDYSSQLWFYDFEKGKTIKLTSGKKDTSFVWLDDENILFISQRRDKKEEKKEKIETELYRIRISGGEAEYLITIPKLVKKFKLFNDKTLLFTGVADLSRDKSDKEREKDYQILEEIPFWSNGKGFTNLKRLHLYLFDFEEGKIKDLTEGNFNVDDFTFIGNKVCINMREFKDKAEPYSDLYLYDLKTERMKRLTDGKMNIGFVHFKDEDMVIFSASDLKIMGVNTNRDIFTLNLKNNKLVRKTDMDKSLKISVGTDSRLGGGQSSKLANNSLYFLTTEGYNIYLNLLEDNKIKHMVNKEGSIDMFDIYNDTIAYVAFRNNQLQELYLYQDGEERQLTQFNEKVLADKKLSRAEYFKVKTSDDCELDAWVMKPVDFEEGRKYPTILDIHGGPKTVYGNIFFHEFQVLANQGYALVFTNPRGSDGRGNEFADIRGRYGTRDYEDLMEVLDLAIERYDFIDPDCLGVTGGSYGGYMTNWIIGHTDRFKAAVSQRSISNWISKFATTDIGYYFVKDQFKGATPWHDYEQLWVGSPLKYANRVTTPTLFIHSGEDYRCWLAEGIQMFTALKYHGVESRLVLFKGENHELSRSGKPEHRIRRLQEMVNWFNKYLKKLV